MKQKNQSKSLTLTEEFNLNIDLKLDSYILSSRSTGYKGSKAKCLL